MTSSNLDTTFESFPSLTSTQDEESIGTKIKRFFLPVIPSNATSSAPTGTFSDFSSASKPMLQDTKSDITSLSALEALSQVSNAPSNASRAVSRRHSRQNSTANTAHAPPTGTGQQGPTRPTSPIPFPAGAGYEREEDELKPLQSSHAGSRPIRLSGVSPSVRLTTTNSERGDFVQSLSSRSLYGDSRYGGNEAYGPASSSLYGSSGGGGGSEFGAALANLSNIPGFPLGRDALDDSRSVRSLSTVARPSASVAHVIRKIRGEVCCDSANYDSGPDELTHVSCRVCRPNTGSRMNQARSASIVKWSSQLSVASTTVSTLMACSELPKSDASLTGRICGQIFCSRWYEQHASQSYHLRVF